eukprot:1277784-Pyramimonas_sp.AAC.1
MKLRLLSLAASTTVAVGVGVLDLGPNTGLGPHGPCGDGQHERREARAVPQGLEVPQQPSVGVVVYSTLHATAAVMLAGLSPVPVLDAVVQ